MQYQIEQNIEHATQYYTGNSCSYVLLDWVGLDWIDFKLWLPVIANQTLVEEMKYSSQIFLYYSIVTNTFLKNQAQNYLDKALQDFPLQPTN